MEKCTFCIQRIKRAEDTAAAEARAVRDGDVITACARLVQPTRSSSVIWPIRIAGG